ncbi:MAG: hypothetical protein ACI915_001658 [Gammaproteobacteria bacterium]|jgi:hypothetical protein
MDRAYKNFSRLRAALLVTGLVTLVTACERHSEANKAAPKVAAQNVGHAQQPTSTAVREQESRKTTNLYGVWRVTGVALKSHGLSVFSRNDPLIMGSEITIHARSLSWTKRRARILPPMTNAMAHTRRCLAQNTRLTPQRRSFPAPLPSSPSIQHKATLHNIGSATREAVGGPTLMRGRGWLS